MQSKPNTRANNRVIDEARFEVADALLKEKNSANLSGRRLVALGLQVPLEVFTPDLYVAPELY